MKNTTKSPGSFISRVFTRGFTLIELLVVIAIITILSGIIITNTSGVKAKSRDAKRISDLGQIQLALTMYFDRCNRYPDNETNVSVGGGNYADNSECGRQKPGTATYYTMSDFIASIPTPPVVSGAATFYHYSVSPDKHDYVLRAILEGPNAAVKDSLYNELIPDWMNTLLFGDIYKFSCAPTNSVATSLYYCLGSK